MKTRSAKNKGKKLQNDVRDRILETFPTLEADDVKSTTMGEGGEDVQLSPAARALFPYSVECKSHKKFAIYSIMDQATNNCPTGATPLVVLKANRREPLVVVSLTEFFDILGTLFDLSEEGDLVAKRYHEVLVELGKKNKNNE